LFDNHGGRGWQFKKDAHPELLLRAFTNYPPPVPLEKPL
jgi:hypothetical protein